MEESSEFFWVYIFPKNSHAPTVGKFPREEGGSRIPSYFSTSPSCMFLSLNTGERARKFAKSIFPKNSHALTGRKFLTGCHFSGEGGDSQIFDVKFFGVGFTEAMKHVEIATVDSHASYLIAKFTSLPWSIENYLIMKSFFVLYYN